jgi:hypothetical protein
MINIGLNGSIVIWCHINLYGEYDFTNTDKYGFGFDIGKIREFDVVR